MENLDGDGDRPEREKRREKAWKRREKGENITKGIPDKHEAIDVCCINYLWCVYIL